jgi:hypothetical protein
VRRRLVEEAEMAKLFDHLVMNVEEGCLAVVEPSREGGEERPALPTEVPKW